jgi:methylated-DNA-[protein]-cysteine S-methyltransferase
MIFFTIIKSPVTKLFVAADENGIRTVSFKIEKTYPSDYIRRDSAPILMYAKTQLEQYFSGELQSFNLPLNMIGNKYQQKVWTNLLKIPYGDTVSYQELASYCHSSTHARAVGNAIGKNPIAIIIPCHRVIRKNGALGGFGGGVGVKKFLLELENKHSRDYSD